MKKEEFIRRARLVHGEKYDYSKFHYVDYRTKVCIICPIHGEFWQSIENHINKACGCNQCGNVEAKEKTKKGLRQFIEDCIKIHGAKYDYSNVVYVNNSSKVKIVCKKHGEFLQTPHNHLNGHGCPLCKAENSSKRQTFDSETFIRRAKELYGEKYDYSLVNYIRNNKKVKIICHKHGVFEQSPQSHLQGCGCRKCARENVKEKLTKKIDYFINQAKRIHGDYYDYSKAVYINNSTDLEILCPKHGSFFQNPYEHISGSGCPHCKSSKGENLVLAYLRSNNIDYVSQYKIINENIFCNHKEIIADFYLPKHNIIIEYNGEQHYKPIEIFGGQEVFEKQQERDYAIRQYCKEHKIKLIEIPYYKIKNISSILREAIC